MPHQSIPELIESLAEKLVLMDGSQKSVFQPLQDDFSYLAGLAGKTGDDGALEASNSAIHIIASTVEGGLAPESALESLCALVGELQHAYCHGLDHGDLISRLSLQLSRDEEDEPLQLSPLADDRILGEFLARQEMVIDELEGLLLAMEKAPTGEASHRLRRLIHTLKGESSLLGMSHVEKVCHAMEDALAAIRLDALFEAKDWLSQAFNHYAGKGPKAGRCDALVAKLENRPSESLDDLLQVALEPDANAAQSSEDLPERVLALDVTPGTDVSLLGDFLNESTEHLEAADLSLMGLENNPTDMDALNAVFRAFHTIKGLAGFLNLPPVRTLAHESENLLDRLRNGELQLTPKITEILFAAVEGLRKLIGLLDQSSPAGNGVALRELIGKIRELSGHASAPAGNAEPKPQVIASAPKAQTPAAEPTVQTEVPTKAPTQPSMAAATPAAASALVVESAGLTPSGATSQASVHMRETVKVEADRLDRLLDTIGELVIAEAMIVQSHELKGKVSALMAQRLTHLDKITRNLQELGTSLRMVPIRPVFQKMARLARDLSHKCNKPVEFTTVGEHTELDKAVVDRIADPLVHMVRNAVDHGIEPEIADREKAGKPATASLKLSAYQKGGSICIELEDDGRGLNREAILRKARDRGILQGDGANLEDREIWAFIFEPGFSTASQVTEVSGRGVGMDVVKRTFEELRGRIDIQSITGKGTRFTVWLPLTMAIIDGMVVRVGRERCIFPTLSVITILPFNETTSVPVLGKGRLLDFQGKQVPVFPLEHFFGEVTEKTGQSRLCVLAETEGRTVGFLVDDLLGKQQIVIKSLGDAFKNIPGLSGGAILTDGGVGLILDIDGLVKSMGHPDALNGFPKIPAVSNLTKAAA